MYLKGLNKKNTTYCVLYSKWYSLIGGILFSNLADIHTPYKGGYVIAALLLLTVTYREFNKS